MTNLLDHNSVIARGLSFIASSQHNDGSFETVIEVESQNTKSIVSTVFATSLMGRALDIHQSKMAQEIKMGISSWLLGQKRDNDWTFNYWATSEPARIDRPYPDDLDDTFCALTVLYQNNPHLFSGNTMAQIAKTLIYNEVEEGGPYRTWIVPPKMQNKWGDIDPVVNANIAAFLYKHNIDLPNITYYLERLVIDGGIQSRYYPNAYATYYFMSTWYAGNLLNEINTQIIEVLDHNFWNNSHNAAFCLTILLRNGHPLDELTPIYNYLCGSQRTDGSWLPNGAWVDSHLNNNPVFACSTALTTALCIEALEEYQQVKRSTQAKSNPIQSTYYRQVVNSMSKTIDELASSDDSQLGTDVSVILNRIVLRDNDHQIVLLPCLVNQMFSANADPVLLQKLSIISLWGWMAYTVYDDILDEGTQLQLLPAANFCHRQLTNNLHLALPSNSEFHKQIESILTKLDVANAWEVSNCRAEVKQNRIKIRHLPDYGDYWQLADRSLGHTIAGLGVLYATGHNSKSNEVYMLNIFFRHYLIARQLNDDAHDWELDLRHGHINAVAVQILQRYFEIHATKKRVIDLEKDGDLLRSLLWDGVILNVSDQIDRHIKLARKALSTGGLGANVQALDQLLVPIEKASRNSLMQRHKTIEFIDAIA